MKNSYISLYISVYSWLKSISFFFQICLYIFGIVILLNFKQKYENYSNFNDDKGKPTTYVYFFFKPWTHASVFFIGFIFGCFIERYNNRKYVLSCRKRYLTWLLTIIIYLSCCFNIIPWVYGRPYDPAWSSIVFPLNQIMWSFHITLIIWLCISGNGGIINRILSSNIIKPYARMTYCVYLVHTWAYGAIIGTRRTLISRSLLFITSILISVIILSYIIALIFTVLFEVPLFHFLEYFKENHLSSINSVEDEEQSKMGNDSKELQTLCNVQKL